MLGYVLCGGDVSVGKFLALVPVCALRHPQQNFPFSVVKTVPPVGLPLEIVVVFGTAGRHHLAHFASVLGNLPPVFHDIFMGHGRRVSDAIEPAIVAATRIALRV